MAKLKATARQCSVCGGPIQDRNVLGICHGTTECVRARSEANRRAKGMQPRGTRGTSRAVPPDQRLRPRYSVAAGEVLGAWTALEDYRQQLIPCRCVCGNERLMRVQYLTQHRNEAGCQCWGRLGRPLGQPISGRVTGPGFLPAGHVSGRLTTLEAARTSLDHPRCICECGKETSAVTAGNLKHGKTRSCGCLALETRTKHGLCKHPLYGIWYGIVGRCTNPKFREYPDYGGRGITVHEGWLGLPDGLLAFAEHIGPRPSPDRTVDRINVDKGYEPGNVRWSPWEEQNRNRRRVGTLTRERDEAQARVRELERELAAARGVLF